MEKKLWLKLNFKDISYGFKICLRNKIQRHFTPFTLYLSSVHVRHESDMAQRGRISALDKDDLIWSDMTLTLDLENLLNDTANSLTKVTLRVKYEQYWTMGLYDINESLH